MTSASGGSIEAFRKPERVVICAPSPALKRMPRFSRGTGPRRCGTGADGDKNETISAQEAFRYAQRKTAAILRDREAVASEHPLMEAATLPCCASEARHWRRATAKQKLLAEKEQTEARIDR